MLSGNGPNRILQAALASVIEVRVLKLNNSCFLDATNVAGQDILYDKCNPPFVPKTKKTIYNQINYLILTRAS